jgi:hypothetical protein
VKKCLSVTAALLTLLAVGLIGYAQSAPFIYLYVAPPTMTTCSYNGAAGVSCAPSADVTKCGSQATPCTLSAAIQRVQVTSSMGCIQSDTPCEVQLSDVAGGIAAPSGLCYEPDGSSTYTIQNLTEGYNPVDAWETAVGTAMRYPQEYIWIHGNDTTPANVIVSGATTCAGTASSAGVGFRLVNTNARISGIQCQYFSDLGDTTVSGCIAGMHSLLYVEDDNYTSDGKSFLVDAHRMSYLLFGNDTVTTTVTNGGLFYAPSGSHVQFVSPLGRARIAIGGTTFTTAPGLMLVNDDSYAQVDGIASLNVTTTASVCVWDAIDSGRINWSDANTFTAPAQTITYNGANLTIDCAQRGSYINDLCRTVGQLTCNLTSFAAVAKDDTDSWIYTATSTTTGNSYTVHSCIDSGGTVVCSSP